MDTVTSLEEADDERGHPSDSVRPAESTAQSLEESVRRHCSSASVGKCKDV